MFAVYLTELTMWDNRHTLQLQPDNLDQFMNAAQCVGPISYDPTNSTGRSSSTVLPIRSFARSILVVDDNPAMRAALRLFIENSTSMRVCEARNGVEAVQQTESQEPDVVIMDLVMPNMNGVEAASVIRSRLPDVRIVVFTLHSGVIGEALAKAIGVDVVVAKSEGAAGLIKALGQIWTEGPPG